MTESSVADGQDPFRIGMPSFNRTDVGNAERLVWRHGDELRCEHPDRRWLVWDGQRWRPDDNDEVLRLAQRTLREAHASESAGITDDEYKELHKHLYDSESRPRLQAMVELAKSDADVVCHTSDLDSDPWLLNVENGTIDLRDGELYEHDPEDLITKLAPVEYDPDATAPKWERFLAEVTGGDDELAAYLQRAVGYSLTGLVREQCFFVAHGAGANGKTTFLETLRRLLGDYGHTSGSELLLRKQRGIPVEVAQLPGRRFVTTMETPKGSRLDEALTKQLTGGDSLNAHRKYGQPFEFAPQCKIWMATNHRPTIENMGEAIWRRIRPVPFEVKIPPKKRDKRLPKKLWMERAGILRWAVEGCLAWQSAGKLGEPSAVVQDWHDYRDEQDVLGQFLEDRCAVGADHKVTSKALYAAYEHWCDLQGMHRSDVLSQKQLISELVDRGFQRVKRAQGEQRGLGGIGLRDDAAGRKLRAVD